MRSGTCGDYSNLIVSVLQRLGYEVMYAYVHRDCYGDEQDHVCAAVREGTEWILIDATQPYRKWHGFACPHREYELLSPDAFEEKMKKEEAYWIDAAKRHGNELYAYYKRYTKENGSIPMMGVISKTSSRYCFSCKPPETIWDNGQFGQAYSAGDIPLEFQTDAWREFQKRVTETVIKADAILRELDCSLSINV